MISLVTSIYTRFYKSTTVMPLAICNIFKEGFYKASHFNISPTSNYNIQDVSNTDGVCALVFDKNKSL